MIDFVFCCSLFTCGLLAACIDWQNFMESFFRFEEFIKVQREVRDESGSRIGFEEVYQRNNFNPSIVVLILSVLLIFFIFVIYIPAKALFEHLENKYTPIVARFGLKKISYRKEMKRRGSWPLAYSNQFANFQEN
uniref:Uncharacterized protein n=1 Tax=Strombidium rassoulzadegani TaxID=1082188 RepID=A0A7S3CRZ2_9SPIT|mmetsp:Transcript_2811/g.4802  ORF Transcript_2811/g.4802 Transcript_2811/m.4802 type:complete len:135 (+) Transcript_2811:43-447(+)